MSQFTDLFYWRVPEAGFEWADRKPLPSKQTPQPEPARFLIECATPPNERAMYDAYDPLATPTLYETFARTDQTEDAFLKFANQYGALGVGGMVFDPRPFLVGESFVQWKVEQDKLRRVVDVIVPIRDGDAGPLKEWFSVESERAVYCRHYEGASFPEMAVVVSRDFGDQDFFDWALQGKSEDDVLTRVATVWAQRQLNEAMSGSRRGSLTLQETMTTSRVVFDLDRQVMQLSVVPRNLLAAMWLQCAKAITDGPTFNTCKHCGKRFELVPGKRRKHSLYCSPNCKMAAYRKRRAEKALEV